MLGVSVNNTHCLQISMLMLSYMSLWPFPFLVAFLATWIWHGLISTDLMHVSLPVSTEIFIYFRIFHFLTLKSLLTLTAVSALCSCPSILFIFNNRFFYWKQSFLIPVGPAHLMPEFWKLKPLTLWLCGIIKHGWDNFSFEVNYLCIQNVRSQIRPCCCGK